MSSENPTPYDLHDVLFYQRYVLDRHAIVSTADLQGRTPASTTTFVPSAATAVTN